MISNMSVPMCNRFRTRRANNGKITSIARNSDCRHISGTKRNCVIVFMSKLVSHDFFYLIRHLHNQSCCAEMFYKVSTIPTLVATESLGLHIKYGQILHYNNNWSYFACFLFIIYCFVLFFHPAVLML